MLSSIFLAALVASVNVMAMPTTTNEPRGTDGLYRVQSNDDGTNTIVDFTPLASINLTIAARAYLDGAAMDVERRQCGDAGSSALCSEPGTTSAIGCKGTVLDQTDLIIAWQYLMNDYGCGVGSPAGLWVYAMYGDAVAYACNYSENLNIDSTVIQDAMSDVSASCGPLGTGFDVLHSDGCQFTDLTVGRDVVGAAFCAIGFTGL